MTGREATMRDGDAREERAPAQQRTKVSTTLREDHLAKRARAQVAVPEADMVETVREVLARHGT